MSIGFCRNTRRSFTGMAVENFVEVVETLQTQGFTKNGSKAGLYQVTERLHNRCQR